MMKKENSELDKLKIEVCDLGRGIDKLNAQIQPLVEQINQYRQEIGLRLQKIEELEKAENKAAT